MSSPSSTMPASLLHAWSAILAVAALAITGEVLIAAAMRRLGDLDLLRDRAGIRDHHATAWPKR